MRPTHTLLALVTVAAMAVAGSAFAQESTAQPATASAAAVQVPARGSTMDSVRAKFGAPSQEVPAVGKPPITRWEYPGYVVYFENEKVLHTVVAR